MEVCQCNFSAPFAFSLPPLGSAMPEANNVKRCRQPARNRRVLNRRLSTPFYNARINEPFAPAATGRIPF
jgi:hypothetical protein